MAVLDTLEVIFKSNADELQSGLEGAEKGAEKTEEQLKTTDKVSEKLGKSFLKTISSAQGAIAAIVSVGAIAKSVLSQAAQTDEIGRFSDRIGQNVEEVSAWSNAIVETGGSAEGFRGTIEGLQGSLTEMALTGGGPAVEVFARLGIQATDAGGKMKNAFDLLPEIAASFEGLSKAETAALGQKLGLDQGTILLLQRGKAGVDALLASQKELGVTTQEDVDTAREFSAGMARLGLSFNNVARRIGTAILPALTAMVDGVSTFVVFLTDNQDSVIAFFAAATTAVLAFYPVLIKTAIAAALSAAPFIAMAAVVAAVGVAFAILYEDIQNFLAGNDSFIGTISEKWPIIGEIVLGVVDAVSSLFGVFSDLFDFLSGKFLEGISSVFQSVRSFLGFSGDELDATVESIKNGEIAIKEAEGNKANNQTAAAIGTTSNQIQKNNKVSIEKLEVDASGGDSKEIAANVSGALQDQLQQTVTNFDDGLVN